jgi:hypothetical protein
LPSGAPSRCCWEPDEGCFSPGGIGVVDAGGGSTFVGDDGFPGEASVGSVPVAPGFVCDDSPPLPDEVDSIGDFGLSPDAVASFPFDGDWFIGDGASPAGFACALGLSAVPFGGLVASFGLPEVPFGLSDEVAASFIGLPDSFGIGVALGVSFGADVPGLSLDVAVFLSGVLPAPAGDGFDIGDESVGRCPSFMGLRA